MKSKLNFRGTLYPGVLIILIVATVISVLLTIRFLTININAAFEVNESALESSTVKIDIEGYKLAAKKLNIQLLPVEEAPTPQPPAEEEQQ